MVRYEDLSDRFRKFFGLPSSPVAMKISDKQLDGEGPKQPSLFCEFVRRAAVDREAVTISENDLQNFAARVILGFMEAKYIDIYPRIKPAATKSIVVAPLEMMSQDPDVVIVLMNPARMMEVMQVLFRATRKRLEASMTCESSALAGEATAIPYMEKKPNLTLLCGGARMIAGYEEDELAMGMPFEAFVKLTESLTEPTLATALCGCLMDDISKHLKEAFIAVGFDKSTDHFYGEVLGKVFRAYLSKDEQGLITVATFHYPLKFKSGEEAQRAINPAKALLAGLGGEVTVSQRENWLDLILTVKFPDGLEKLALDVENFKGTINKILSAFASTIDRVAPA